MKALPEIRLLPTRMIILIGVLGLLQSIPRLIFYYMAAVEKVPLLQSWVQAQTLDFINFMFLSLGIAGLVVFPGFLLRTKWGYVGVVGVCAVTIIFDGISAVAVAYTAVAGLILPALFLVYLFSRPVFWGAGKPAHG